MTYITCFACEARLTSQTTSRSSSTRTHGAWISWNEDKFGHGRHTKTNGSHSPILARGRALFRIFSVGTVVLPDCFFQRHNHVSMWQCTCWATVVSQGPSDVPLIPTSYYYRNRTLLCSAQSPLIRPCSSEVYSIDLQLANQATLLQCVYRTAIELHTAASLHLSNGFYRP